MIWGAPVGSNFAAFLGREKGGGTRGGRGGGGRDGGCGERAEGAERMTGALRGPASLPLLASIAEAASR